MKSWIYVFGVVGIVAIAALGLLAQETDAQGHMQVWVDDDGAPDWYDGSHVRTIQEAIANVSAGGTIHVWNGTYTENVDVGKTVTIMGNGSAHCNVQAADDNDHVFDITADWVNVSG